MDQSSYFDLKRPGEGRERTAYFVLDSLLRSRIDCGFESNSDRYDEDVNVYLVDLLSRLVRATEPGRVGGPIREIDVFEQVRDSRDPRFKSRVYRTTADRLLVATGLFVSSPYVERDGQRDFDDSARDRIDQGKSYYRWASWFQQRAPAGSPVVANVLQLLSEYFERYVDVLFHMRGEYFHLYERLRDTQLSALQDPTKAGEDGPVPSLPLLRDEFLDAYWSWHQQPDPGTRARLDTAVTQLRAADPDFHFDLPQ